jgi:hypothetical protein
MTAVPITAPLLFEPESAGVVLALEDCEVDDETAVLAD